MCGQKTWSACSLANQRLGWRPHVTLLDSSSHSSFGNLVLFHDQLLLSTRSIHITRCCCAEMLGVPMVAVSRG